MDMLDIKFDLPNENDRCRTCMMKMGKSMFNIFEHSIHNIHISEILNSLTSLCFDENDQLPKHICILCFKKLSSFYEFIVDIKNNNVKFKKELEDNEYLFCHMEKKIDFREVQDTSVHENESATVKLENDVDISNLIPEDDIFVCSGNNVEFIGSVKCKTENKYTCKLCNKCFKNERNYQRHSEKHSYHTKLNNVYAKDGKLLREMAIEISTNRELFVCENCNDSFKNKHTLYEHLEKYTLNGTLICSEIKSHLTYYGQGTSNFICHSNEISPTTLDTTNEYSSAEKNIKETIKCPICSSIFKSQRSLSAHVQKSQDCKKLSSLVSKFRNENAKENRSKTSTGEDFICDICKGSFRNKQILLEHIAQHIHKELFTPCNGCNKEFSNAIDLKHHIHKDCKKLGTLNDQYLELKKAEYNILIDTNESEFICKICNTKFKNKYSMSAHMRKHVDKGRILSCSTCGKIFTKVSHLKRHEVTHDNKGQFKCGVCKKSYSTEELLEQHSKHHKEAKIHVCPVCHKGFTNIPALNSHIKIHTRNKLYLCSYCGKRFDSSTNLNQHHQRHIGIKTFTCTLCPRKFVTKGELTSHTRTHTGVRPHKCKQCNATFTKRSSLVKHNLRHLGIKPYNCDTCSKKFSSQSSLKCHYRTHTGEKPYSCDICARAFTQSNDLVKHRRRHLGEKLFKCDQCTESFRLKTELKNHISQHYVSRIQQENIVKNLEEIS